MTLILWAIICEQTKPQIAAILNLVSEKLCQRINAFNLLQLLDLMSQSRTHVIVFTSMRLTYDSINSRYV